LIDVAANCVSEPAETGQQGVWRASFLPLRVLHCGDKKLPLQKKKKDKKLSAKIHLLALAYRYVA
jgi:hypothetical protein